jgi:hypothetical protein
VTATVEPIRLERFVPGIGTVEFVESERRRDYWLLPEGGERRRRMPSVTSILRRTWPKPALLEWYAREGRHAETLLEQASARGKAVHKFVETFMESGDLLPWDDFPSEWHGYLQGVARFLWEHQPQPLAVERLVVYPELNYAGRLDLIAAVDGAPTLLDFKSNPKGRIYDEAHVQAHAYKIADGRCGGDEIAGTLLVGIAEDGTYHPVPGADASKIWGSILDFYKTLARFDKELEKVGVKVGAK